MSFDYTQLTKADLVLLLQDKHGITIKELAKTSKASLISRLNDLEGITVPQPLGEQAVNENAPKSGDKHKLIGVVINIHMGETVEKQQDVFVGANGKGFQLQRGQNVQVPPIVYGILKTAIEKTLTPERDTITGRMVLKEVEALRYPFSVIEKVYA